MLIVGEKHTTVREGTLPRHRVCPPPGKPMELTVWCGARNGRRVTKLSHVNTIHRTAVAFGKHFVRILLSLEDANIIAIPRKKRIKIT